MTADIFFKDKNGKLFQKSFQKFHSAYEKENPSFKILEEVEKLMANKEIDIMHPKMKNQNLYTMRFLRSSADIKKKYIYWMILQFLLYYLNDNGSNLYDSENKLDL